MSAKWGIDDKDVKSALRHAVLPLFAGAGVAALQTAQSGSFSFVAMKGAAVTAVLAGGIRLLQRWVTEIAPK